MARRKRPLPALIEQLKRSRKDRKLSPAAVAREIGMTKSGLLALERGISRPSFDTLVAWVETLGLTLLAVPALGRLPVATLRGVPIVARVQ